MDVFLIPVGAGPVRALLRAGHRTEPEDEPAANRRVCEVQRRFSELLRAAEERRHEEDDHDSPSLRSWTGRMQDRMMSWIAKRVAEQRLLWNLRKQERVVAVHPSDMTFDEVMPHIQQALQRDYERHRNWLIVDTVGLVVSGLLAIVPGPNLLAYYFLFRVGGHWLSMRGATQGRRRVEWEGRPCEPLNGVARCISRMGAPRAPRTRSADRLGASSAELADVLRAGHRKERRGIAAGSP